ncbi:MAG TPA: hypothetical protein VGF12_25625, partial [Roseateles sp.]|uniref:hypothetical protein n=1 Tax=Roseateles sp. TaxID=1971397 RepID=UPI002EDA3FED
MPLPSFLSSLLNRSRASLLVVLVFVLPLQGVVQLVAGVQGHRHVHIGAQQVETPWRDAALSLLGQPLRAALERLHAAHDPRLSGQKFSWMANRGPSSAMHEHGGVFHEHSAETHDVVD